MEWFDLINETLQAFLIIPLYSILNKILKDNEEDFARQTFKTGLVTFFLYMLFSIGVLIYGSVLVKAMNPEEFDVKTASYYLQLETVAFMIGIIVSFVNVVFVVVGKDKNIYIFLAISTVLSIVADFALIPNFGVYGVAGSNIIVNTVLAVASFLMLYFQKLTKPCWFKKSDGAIFKKWLKIGVFSGFQSFIANIVYALMIGRMVNLVAEQGNYWIANNFVWSWLLIPITALGEVIKRDCKDGYKELKQFNYYFIGFITIVIWAISIPLWKPYLSGVLKSENSEEIFMILIKLVPFYVAYIGCAIINNIFDGIGATYYNAIVSAIVNLVYYGIFFILYLTKTINFTMTTIILMFGFGMVFHFIISIILEKAFLRRFENKKIQKLALENQSEETQEVTEVKTEN